MFQKILLYVIAGLALLCMGLGITVAVEEVRIARLKAELNTAILERDSLKALSTSQTENLANLNILLSEQDKACRKRLDARRSVDNIFEKHTPAKAVEQIRSSSGVSVPPPNLATKVQVNYEVISFDESISSIGIINDNLRMFRSEGYISGISPRVLPSDPSGASPARR